MTEVFKPTPWDQKAFGFATYEVLSISDESLESIRNVQGHFTVKVDPLVPTETLFRHGFYYCDTLINPYCSPEKLIVYEHSDVGLSRAHDIDRLRRISSSAFVYGRFHRDFNISRDMADRRYWQWLAQLVDEQTVFSFLLKGEVVGFFAYTGASIALHALDESIRGRGLAKYFWSRGCLELFKMGLKEVHSSISAYNLPVLNLYASLGFRFRNPLNCYHRYNFDRAKS